MKAEIIKFLSEKRDLYGKREHNKREVKRLVVLKLILKNVEDKKILSHQIRVGTETIESQTLELEDYTRKAMAQRLGISKTKLDYHIQECEWLTENRSNPKRQNAIVEAVKRPLSAGEL